MRGGETEERVVVFVVAFLMTFQDFFLWILGFAGSSYFTFVGKDGTRKLVQEQSNCHLFVVQVLRSCPQ